VYGPRGPRRESAMILLIWLATCKGFLRSQTPGHLDDESQSNFTLL
jgi:hypothetical protein